MLVPIGTTRLCILFWNRTKESIWIENYKNKTLTDDAIIQAMAEHPILIERPIVIKGDKAIIGRIPEEVAQFI